MWWANQTLRRQKFLIYIPMAVKGDWYSSFMSIVSGLLILIGRSLAAIKFMRKVSLSSNGIYLVSELASQWNISG